MWRTLTVVVVVLLAGCGSVTGPESETATPTTVGPSPTATATETPTATTTETDAPATTTTGSPTPTPTSGGADLLAPGVTQRKVVNATALVSAHSDALMSSGFVVASEGQATVARRGTLVVAHTTQQATVESERTAYVATRRDEAGPFTREVDAYFNGSSETYRRIEQPGSTERGTRDPRPNGTLTGKGVLGSHFRGGAFTVSAVNESNGSTRITLTADAVKNEKALLKLLPDGAQEVTAYKGTAVVDGEGRVHSFTATVEYVIQGESKTYKIAFEIVELGNVTAQRPGWVDDGS